MGIIVKNGIEYGGSGGNASDINYDNSRSGLSGSTTQTAIDELAGKAKAALYVVSFDAATGTLVTKSEDYTG